MKISCRGKTREGELQRLYKRRPKSNRATTLPTIFLSSILLMTSKVVLAHVATEWDGGCSSCHGHHHHNHPGEGGAFSSSIAGGDYPSFMSVQTSNPSRDVYEPDDDPSPDDIDGGCYDSHQSCPYWASIGECDANTNYMTYNCRKSCRTCDRYLGGDTKTNRRTLETDDGRVLVYNSPEERFGERQRIDGQESETAATKRVLRETLDYMETEVLVKPEYDKVKDECKNRNELCAFWAGMGECEKNPKFMKLNCPPSCKTCHLVDIEARCPLDPNAKDAMGPGDLNRMFERIVDPANDEIARYKPVVLSRPAPEGGNSVADGGLEKDYQSGPWVVTFDDFLTSEEVDRIVEHGYTEGYKRSKDVGARKFDGTHESKTSDGRTSENAWCSNGCREEEVSNRVMERISNITGVPPENSESFQILKYEVGQYYNTHHDYIAHHQSRPCGVRIRGGTHFPDFDTPLTVMPKKGKALLWPSVLDSDPNQKDFRTTHGALPVEAGTKLAANAWVHLRDYIHNSEGGCC